MARIESADQNLLAHNTHLQPTLFTLFKDINKGLHLGLGTDSPKNPPVPQIMFEPWTKPLFGDEFVPAAWSRRVPEFPDTEIKFGANGTLKINGSEKKLARESVYLTNWLALQNGDGEISWSSLRSRGINKNTANHLQDTFTDNALVITRKGVKFANSVSFSLIL